MNQLKISASVLVLVGCVCTPALLVHYHIVDNMFGLFLAAVSGSFGGTVAGHLSKGLWRDDP